MDLIKNRSLCTGGISMTLVSVVCKKKIFKEVKKITACLLARDWMIEVSRAPDHVLRGKIPPAK